MSAWGGPCAKCGHPASYHGATFCKVQSGAAVKRDCDCHGYADVERLRCAHCGEVGCDWIGDIHKARAEAAEAALLDARAEVERLRDSNDRLGGMVEWFAEMVTDARDALVDARRQYVGDLRGSRPVGKVPVDVQAVLAILDRERTADPSRYDASRAAHAALVADLRALHQHDGRHGCATCLGVDAFPHPWPCETAELLDRHAPEEGS